jgi:glycosyltransferase involved in cell wall biosynthesis
MRIGIPLKSHDPGWGGPGTYTIEIVKHLLQADTRNEYALFYPRSPEVSRYFGQYRSLAPRVREIDIGTRSGFHADLAVVPHLARKLGVDVFFSPFTALPLHGRFRKVMTVLGAERYAVPGLLSLRAALSWRLMETVTLWRADRVLAISETMKRDFCQALKFPPERVCTTYLGVNPAFQPVDDGERLRRVREQYRLPEHFVLFVGYLFPNKNFTNLVKGFHTVAADIPHHLVVCGGRRWKYEADLAQVQVLGLTERVRFLDFVPQDDLVALFSLATCFAFPSLYESFGLAMVEAMSCGCPVVASNTGALPEIAGDAALFCDPLSPADIGRAIHALAGDPALQATYRERALARAREFTWERTARETLAVLEELA